MSTPDADIVTHRMDDRVQFLAVVASWGHTNGIKIGQNRVGVVCWLREMADTSPVSLTVDAGGFSLHQALTPEQARRIARALNAAAREAEALKSTDPLDDASSANGGQTCV